MTKLARGNCTAVDQSTHDPKGQGLNPAANGARRKQRKNWQSLGLLGFWFISIYAQNTDPLKIQHIQEWNIVSHFFCKLGHLMAMEKYFQYETV
jgi:hypothetical protein